jgi:uncharacterized membrane protein YdfJ with MMPL/SSD domain
MAHATEELVRTIRGMKDGFRSADGATVLVTGQTALYNDFSKTLDDALLPCLGLVVGFCLASAVLFDAFVVRMALVPALFALLGRSAWWLPSRLDRLLPDMDVEGEKLNRLPTAAQIPGSRREGEPHYVR